MKRLLLLGGGHSHVEVLREFGERPLTGVEVTLVNPFQLATYSGMLPGLVAGHYAYRDCHIDLASLTRFAGARLVQAPAQAIDATRRKVLLTDASELAYDVVSIDVGSVPAAGEIANAAPTAVAVNPFQHFLSAWDGLVGAAAGTDGIKRIAVVGGGAGGVELLLAAQYRLSLRQPSRPVRFALVTETPQILPTHNSVVRSAFLRILSARGVDLHLNARVQRIDAGAVVVAQGARIPADRVLWATGAAPPPLLLASTLARDAGGFLAINQYLQSISHADVFAAGDCASIQSHRVPKSGVYAVRQGPLLAGNLRHALAGESLTAYRPQRRALALISRGDRYAVASYGPVALEGAWVWRWKNHIDRKFVARYSKLGKNPA